jgi:hypothetical protein
MAERCQHTKPDGARCGAFACAGSARAAEREQARRRGGKAAHKRIATLPADTPDAPLGTLGEVAVYLAATVNRVARGELDVKVANSIALLAGQLQRCIERGDVEARLAALEAARQTNRGLR